MRSEDPEETVKMRDEAIETEYGIDERKLFDDEADNLALEFLDK
jgi:hypothetical protein